MAAPLGPNQIMADAAQGVLIRGLQGMSEYQMQTLMTQYFDEIPGLRDEVIRAIHSGELGQKLANRGRALNNEEGIVEEEGSGLEAQ